MDRIDTLCDVEILHVPFEKLGDKRFGESSENVQEGLGFRGPKFEK